MEAQVENAVEIAGNPRADQELKAQAFEFINQLRAEPQAWSVCLPLAVRQPRASEVTRVFALEIVNHAIQTAKIDQSGLLYVKDQLWQYLQGVLGSGDSERESPSTENKMTQTMAYLFTALYASQWTTFFEDMLSLTRGQNNANQLDVDGTRFYLKTLASIHDEIADIMVSRNRQELQRDNNLKDLIRDRDVNTITRSWQEILSRNQGGDVAIVEHCLLVIGRWASWTDLSLIINDTLLSLLYGLVSSGLASREGQTARLRDISLNTYMDILGKKMKSPEKLQLIEALNVQAVVSQLAGSPPLHDTRFTPEYDTDLAELVGKLVNNTVDDIVNILDSGSPEGGSLSNANQQLHAFLPFVLRFFSDEYDEVCSSVIPCLTNLLTFFRKHINSDSEYLSMLPSILQAIVQKMKYDETSDWGDENAETDEAEFSDLRKRLQILQHAVAAVDETLYMNTITELVVTSFSTFQERKGQMNWRDIDLALHEMFLFGQLAIKHGGLYSKSKPTSAAAGSLISMMVKLVESGVAEYAHPAISLQYMEICVRYCTFFEANPNFIPAALEQFIRFVHHNHVKVKFRSWYLFHRFIRQLRLQLGNIAQNVIQAIGDLLLIKAELPEETSDGEDISSNENVQSADSRFASQLYLYEAIGNICSVPSVPVQTQVFYVQSVMAPLFADLESQLPAANTGDERALLQIHHLIMALGTLAHGFSEWTPGRASSTGAPAKEVSLEFKKAAEAILVALESLKQSSEIRAAARNAFSRLVGVLGNEILQQLPRWIDGLLSRTSSKDEMATFLRLLDQVVFGFKSEIFNILNTLLTPFLQRVFDGIQEPTTGTDDEIQLSELKSEYLSFLLVILNNDLARVFVTDENQPVFEALMATLEHFARDSNDLQTAKLAFAVLTRMVGTWGGPDIVSSSSSEASAIPPQPALPGFDRYMMERFSPLSWALPSAEGFNPKDAHVRQVLLETASLKRTIYLKTGDQYLSWLRDSELPTTGMSEAAVERFLGALGTHDMKAFRNFFANFVSDPNSQ